MCSLQVVGPFQTSSAPWKAVKAGKLEPREALSLFLAWVRFSVRRWGSNAEPFENRTLLRLEAPSSLLVSNLSDLSTNNLQLRKPERCFSQRVSELLAILLISCFTESTPEAHQ